MKIPFVTSGKSRVGQGLPNFELQNLYPATEGQEFQGLVRPGPCLVQVAGATQWTSVGPTAIRGLFQFPGAGGSDLYLVAGQLGRVNSSGALTTLGAISGSDPVIFDMIRDTVILSGGGLAYFTTGGARTQITDPDLGAVSSVAGLDGRLLASREGTDTFVWSNVFDPGNIDSLAFATAETYGDRLVRVMTHESGLVYLFGERSVEVWQRTGDADTPFARAGGMVYPYGVASKMSCAKQGPLFFFVGTALNDGAPFVGMLSPSFERISDPGIERLLRQLSTANLAAIRSFAYRQNGATIYQMNMPGFQSWCFHVESRTWFRRRHGTNPVWHSSSYADAFGRHLVGSDSNGTIWQMADNPAVYTDAGEALNRIATCYLPVERPTPLQSLFLDAMTRDAVGTPTAVVEISQDDGNTYRPARTVNLDAPNARQNLSLAWGAIRRPGALVRVTVSGDFGVALYNLLVNELAT